MRTKHPRRNANLLHGAPRILVLGGNGFIGRYTVRELLSRRARVVIGTRHVDVATPPPDNLEFRQIRFQEMLEPAAWQNALDGIDGVINVVGILRERGEETFERVHHHAPAALASACANRGVPLVHVSALGIDNPVGNPFSTSKLRGEKALQKCGGLVTILRASVVDAVDGYGSGWFHRVAQWPVYLLPAGANKLLSPVLAEDLGEALARLALGDVASPQALLASGGSTPGVRLLEVGCGESFTLETYLHRLRGAGAWPLDTPWFCVKVPVTLARLAACFFDRFDLTPYSIGHHELLEHDNKPVWNALPMILGRAPRPITASVEPLSVKPATSRLSGLFAYAKACYPGSEGHPEK